MLLRIIFSFAAILTFLFLFWRKLKEDYIQNQIFSTGFYSLFGIAIMSLVSHYLLPAWLFWLSLGGSFFGVLIGIKKYNLRFFEVLEGWVYGNLGILIFTYIYIFVKKLTLEEFFTILVLSFLIFLFTFLDKYYKKFIWYKSGRVGFTGLAILGIFFLIRCLVAIVYPGMVFFVGKSDIILSGSFAFAAFLFLYNLSKE